MEQFSVIIKKAVQILKVTVRSYIDGKVLFK